MAIAATVVLATLTLFIAAALIIKRGRVRHSASIVSFVDLRYDGGGIRFRIGRQKVRLDCHCLRTRAKLFKVVNVCLSVTGVAKYVPIRRFDHANNRCSAEFVLASHQTVRRLGAVGDDSGGIRNNVVSCH